MVNTKVVTDLTSHK